MSQEPPCKHRTSPIGRKLRSCAACEIEEMHRAPVITHRANALLLCSVCRRSIEAFLGLPSEADVIPSFSTTTQAIKDHALASPGCIGGTATVQARPATQDNYAQVKAMLPPRR